MKRVIARFFQLQIDVVWRKEIAEHMPEKPIILVGTKSDLQDTQEEKITEEKIESVKKALGAKE